MTTEHARTERPKAPRKISRDLPVAVGVGLGFGGIVLLALFTVKETFIGLVAVLVALALWELARAMYGHGIRISGLPLVVGGVTMLIAAYAAGPRGLAAGFGFTALAIMVWRMGEGVHGYVRDMTASIFAAAYIPLLGSFVILMLHHDDGSQRVVLFILITICSDIGGFFAGSFLGKHKMAPAISPKKTWEGFAGGALACMLIGALGMPLLLDGSWWQGTLLGAAGACSAVLGDLIESMIKRDIGVKDMGSLLPEHGGVLDRVDSLLATAPVAWLFLEWFA